MIAQDVQSLATIGKLVVGGFILMLGLIVLSNILV